MPAQKLSGNARIQIAGQLFLPVKIALRQVSECQIPGEWVDTSCPPSREPVLLSSPPIIWCNNGVDEQLNWILPTVLSPSLSMSDQLYVCVIDDSGLFDDPGMEKLVRFLLHNLERAASENLDPHRRRYLLRPLVIDEQLQDLVGKYVLGGVRGGQILKPRYFVPLIKGRVQKRTLQDDASIIADYYKSARELYDRLRRFNNEEDFKPKLPGWDEFNTCLDESTKSKIEKRLSVAYWEYACDAENSEGLRKTALKVSEWWSKKRG
ncbi:MULTISPECIES: hypothetical protein [Ectothiorhodospira]|uniref:hypothetical protein n=1 Tax=Ectothiorhodospira TaxID=1051 RepID=UPI001EE79D92|nr:MULTISPECIES: hypothetical protein [Ectothiorhodospira]MCG5495885.1 hypothetical protein [Ectothiorhodospira variabilis]MCG5498512.1 hypothetical protein [Ectothiorhodospira variabilis]MCG5505286.1 hypothetical protein [Ectothiorhodospira variabilis]MCG5508443.1 hypothetical protein [Ectothiorhodospira variabilis]MCG5525923.1 hypothetical protein [Ectothiorhodospira haloalkaliphila]